MGWWYWQGSAKGFGGVGVDAVSYTVIVMDVVGVLRLSVTYRHVFSLFF